MKRTFIQKVGIFLFASFLVLSALFPFVQMLSTSLKSPLEWGRPNLIPKVIDGSAYTKLIRGGESNIRIEDLDASTQKILQNPKLTDEQRQTILEKYSQEKRFPFLTYMGNSLFIALLASASSLIVSVFGAYAVARLKFKGQRFLQRGILFVYLIGGLVIMVPLYQLATMFRLTATDPGIIFVLILIYILQTLPLAVYMLSNYFRSLPYTIEEAAKIDGSSPMGIIIRIIIPLSKPILATVFIYCFIIAWNEYLYASVFLSGHTNLYTAPIALKTLFVSQNAIWARIMAASILTLTPILLFFVVLSRNLQSSLAEGGVKE